RAADLDDVELGALSLGGGGWLLLECPLTMALSPGFPALARMLASRGHRILLAHPERCPAFLQSPTLLEELVADGMLAQVTARSLRNRFGKAAQAAALRWTDQGLVHVVASDGHGAGRPATMSEHLADAGFEPALSAWLTREVPEALLAGTAPPPRPMSNR